MKRILSLLNAISLLICCAIFGSCKDKKISLTKDNYSTYLAVNYFLSDYSTSNGTASCKISVYTSPKGNYYFEDVVITYQDPIRWEFSIWESSIVSPEVSLSYTGESYICYIAKTSNMFFKKDPPSPCVASISGYIIEN